MSGPHPWQQLVRMIVGSWVARAIYVAAKLRVADRLADGPRTAEELADAAGVAPRPLYRLLRALAGVGVFAYPSEHPEQAKILDAAMSGFSGRATFAAHGFRLTRVVPTAGDISVVEGVPA